MILTVTPNPMLDKTLWLEELRTGETHRAQRLEVIAGGKGINVARALRGLGENTLATGFLGGPAGTTMRALLDSDSIPHEFIETAGTTREGFTVVENKSGRRTAVFEPGPQLYPKEVEALLAFVQRRLPESRALALCGSMPSPGYDELYAEMIHLAHAAHVPVFLDSYLEPLKLGLAARPQFLKPNREEALQTFGIDTRAAGGMQKVMHRLASFGTQCFFLTDADRPIGVGLHGKQYLATPPPVACRNPLGSGDAMVAGFLYAWLQGWPAEELIRFAVAAGSVNARHTMPGYANLEEIKALAVQVKIESS